MHVIKIPYDVSKPCIVHEIPDRTDDSVEASGRVLDDIKKLIGIEWAEIVYLSTIKSEDPHRDYCFIVDEVGKCKDGWPDRINVRASSYYPGTAYGDPIVGDVVICARQWIDSFGECDLAGLELRELFKFMAHFANIRSKYES